MPLQDLTPQLRTRLSRMERAVGLFVLVAAALLIFGFGYYVYKMARDKGWFLTKITYQTSISTSAGLRPGDPVKLMGRDVGEIVRIEPNAPGDYYNITVDIRLIKPYYGYVWTDSKVRVAAGNLLGNRYLEITKGTGGVPTVLETSEKEAVGILRRDYFLARKQALSSAYTNDVAGLHAALNAEAKANPLAFYTNLNARIYWIEADESPSVTERLEQVVDEVQEALPGILALTNQLAVVLSNAAVLTANLNEVAIDAQPAVRNLALATEQLDRPGGLGEWLLPTNLNTRLDSVLAGADQTLTIANTNLAPLAMSLARALDNLAGITSNLHNQVEANSNILSQISQAVIDADTFVQGLKGHWLLRSAFRDGRESDDRSETGPRDEPLRSPKDAGAR